MVSDPSDADAAAEARQRALEILRQHGHDATSFQLLEPGFRYFFTDQAFVAYVDTGGAWVAGGGPVAAAQRRFEVAAEFVAAARAAGRRACFFAVDAGFRAAGWPCLHIGEQPHWDPRCWDDQLEASASLRYQLRRAAAKGVTVRRLEVDEIADAEAPTRRAIEELIAEWKAQRAMAPMGFLVDVEPFHFPEERIYLVAEHEGRVVAFLAAVPVYGHSGWFFEDFLRIRAAPNGTVELLIDAGMRAAAETGSYVTMGLAPLAGDVPRRLRLARELARPLYDFSGLRAFKAKLQPDGWQPMYLAAAPGRSVWRALWDALAAFAAGSMIGFGVRTLTRGPLPLLWVLSLLLVLWTPLLAIADVAHWFPSAATKWAWVGFDLALAAGLLALCRSYRQRLAIALAVMVTADAALTAAEATWWNLPRFDGAFEITMLTLACTAPVLAATALWAMVLQRRARRRR